MFFNDMSCTIVSQLYEKEDLDVIFYQLDMSNQNEAQIFNGAMASLTSSHASMISSTYDFSQFNSIIDIGGGQGMFLSTILKNNPNVRGILFDLPHAIASAKKMYYDRVCKCK